MDVGEKAGEKLFAVIDYKSGKAPKSSPATLVKKGKSFQLPLYLAMGEELLRERGREAKPLAGMFCYLTSPDREAWEFTREELEESRETLLAALKRFLAMMSRGRFFFNDRGGMCDYCPVRRMCRKEHRPSSGRIRRSDEAKGYYEIIGEKPARPA
ncbi:MAG: hypothetical protein A2Z34_07975 [Planctomycetes bacterium RBG_16_59_8]|nr:MAG: hypothetical protein A2Z34_07975 [Planctomycetes bacterium RBG_16_59_8]